MKAGSGSRAVSIAAIIALLSLPVLVTPVDALGLARFSANVTSGPAPLTVQFTDQTVPPDFQGSGYEWTWSFGDGSTSEERSPVHTFTTADTYTASLIVTNGIGPTTGTTATPNLSLIHI